MTSAQTAARFAAQVAGTDLIWTLHHVGGATECFTLRHDSPVDGTEFSVRRASDGRGLGCASTQAEAEMLAEINLSQTARGL